MVNPNLTKNKVLIRDLSEGEFRERYHCDRFTATVLASRYRYIIQHLCSGLLTTAFSIILRDWYDFAATLSGPADLDYAMPAVSNSLVLFSGTMTEAVRNTVEEYGVDRLKPGDVLMCNDPYRTGTHVNDVCFVRPVFYKGSPRPIGFINLQAHMLDMGGIVPGGFTGITKHNVYETGLVISPRLLYEAGVPHKPTWSLLFDNARFGELIMPDIMTIYQNLLLGERLLIETIDRYGLDAYLGAIEYACDLSAESMQLSVATLPDGVYEAEEWVDADGVDEGEEYKVKVKVVIKGDRAEVDLSGTSRQARTSINAGWLDAKTAVLVAFKMLLDPEIDLTSGAFRNIDLVLPEGTIVSAMPPDGAIFLYWESSTLVLLAILRALRDALGENAVAGDYGSLNLHNAYGIHPETGMPWVTMAQCGGEHGPWGASKAGDADSCNVGYLGNNLDPATEAIEMDVPAVVLRKEYVADSGGPGEHRGGAAVAKDTLWLTEAEHHSMPLHLKRPSGFGVKGGKDGARGAVWVWKPGDFDINERPMSVHSGDGAYQKSLPIGGMLNPLTKTPDPNGQYFYYGRVPAWQTKPNTVFRYLTNGGGGWGNPLERDPEMVKRDVRDEYVTTAGARRDYGVVVKGDPVNEPEGLAVDYDATSRLRAQLRQTSG